MANNLASLVRRRNLGFTGMEGELLNDNAMPVNALASYQPMNTIRASSGEYITPEGGRSAAPVRFGGNSLSQLIRPQRLSGDELTQMAILANRSPQQASMAAQRFLQANPDFANEPGFSVEELAANMSDNTFSNILGQRAKNAYAEQERMAAMAEKPSDRLAREKFEWEKSQGKPDKPLTEFQGKAALFGSRAATSSDVIDQLGTGEAGAAKTLQYWQDVPLVGRAANAMSSDNTQKLAQAQRDFVNAVLRLESGATISDVEFQNASQQYFPQPGDSPQVVAQKKQNRELAIQGLGELAGEKGGAYINKQRAAMQPNGQKQTISFEGDKEARYQAWKAQQGR